MLISKSLQLKDKCELFCMTPTLWVVWAATVETDYRKFFRYVFEVLSNLDSQFSGRSQHQDLQTNIKKNSSHTQSHTENNRQWNLKRWLCSLTGEYLGRPASAHLSCILLEPLHQRYGKGECFSCSCAGLGNYVLSIIYRIKCLYLNVKKVGNSPS